MQLYQLYPRVRARVIAPAQRESGLNFPAFKARICMDILITALVTFFVVLLILYLVNMSPINRRAREIVRVTVIVIGVLSLPGYLVNF
jgi:hypothetical protein